MPNLDWRNLQAFVAVAENGSLSAAARHMGSSQPTLSRHIAQLETDMGCRLFDRAANGVTLTQTGSDLMERARRMADAAAELGTLRGGASQTLGGTVRVTASCIVASFLLPDILTQFRYAYPEIEIELVASDATTNLLRREADIAIRMYRPTQPDVITRRVGALALGAYAATSYVARYGNPAGPADIAGHHLIGYDRNTIIIDAMAARGIKADRGFFGFRSDDQVACWQMVRAGLGIGFMQRFIGDNDPMVQRVLGEASLGDMPVWLTAHQDLHSSPRIRRLFDHLATDLARITASP